MTDVSLIFVKFKLISYSRNEFIYLISPAN